MKIHLHKIVCILILLAFIANKATAQGVTPSDGGCGTRPTPLISSIQSVSGNTVICVASTPAAVSLTTSNSVGTGINANHTQFLIYTEFSLSNSGFIEAGNPLPITFNPTISSYNPIKYSLVLVDTSTANYCRDSSSVTIQLVPALGPNLAISAKDRDGDSVYCVIPGDPNAASDPVKFKPQFNMPAGTDLTGYAFTWNMGDGTPSFTLNDTATFLYTYNNQGIFNVTMHTLSPGGCTDDDTIKITYIRTNNLAILPMTGVGKRFCVPQTYLAEMPAGVFYDRFVWNFGDGTASVTTYTNSVPSHTYIKKGLFNITVSGFNACGSDGAALFNLDAIKGAKAYFSNKSGGVETLLGCEPMLITFKDTSKDVPTTWAPQGPPAGAPNFNPTGYFVRWDLGTAHAPFDVTSGTHNPPPQSYSAGVYYIKLIAYSFCGNDTIIKKLIVNRPPIANFTYNTSGICSPVLVSSIINTSIDTGYAPTYNWTINGTTVGTTTNIPNQTITTTGSTLVNAPVNLTVTNNCGSNTKLTTVASNPAVVANFKVNEDSICTGQSLLVTDLSQGTALSYNWNYGGNGNTSNATNSPSTQSYTTLGKDTIKLILTGACGTKTKKQPLIIKGYPKANVTTADSVICPGATAKFTNATNSGNASTYSWANGASSNPTSSTNASFETVQYSNPGIVYVKLTVDSIGCKTTDSVKVRINPRPFTQIAANKLSVCSPDTVVFTNNSVLNTGDTYYWNYGNGVTSTSFAPQATPPLVYSSFDDSTITVYFKISSGTSGCVDSNSLVINTHPYPTSNFTVNDTVCLGGESSFANTTSQTITGTLNDSWKFGDNVTSVDKNPKHTYSAVGNYEITLQSTSQYGCVNVHKDTITILGIPVPLFNFPIVCEKDSTQLDASPSTGAASYSWDFGNVATGANNTSTAMSPKHLYSTNGIFTVKLTIKNSFGCTDSLKQVVKVNPKPVADFKFGNAGFGTGGTCAQKPISFLDQSSTNIIKWDWNFNDASLGQSQYANTQTPIHTYPNPTSTGFDVILHVENNYGCKDSIKKHIIIFPKPKADFTFDTSCATIPTQFYNLSQHPGTFAIYIWAFGDGNWSVYTRDPYYAYQNDTGFTVMLAVQDQNRCQDTIYKKINVRPTPQSGFNVDIVCNGLPTHFTDTIARNQLATTNWFWTFGDGASSASNTPVHQYANPGSYTTTVINTDKSSGCTSTYTKVVTVLDIVRAKFDIRDSIFCQGDIVPYQDLTSATSPYTVQTYSWHFGDGGTSTLQNPTYAFDTSGVFIDTLSVTTNGGCNSKYMRNIYINPKPKADFSAFNFCDQTQTQFADSSIVKTGQTIQWFWNFGNAGASQLQNPSYTYPAPGKYSVTLTTTTGKGCKDTMQKFIDIYPKPIAGFISNLACFSDSTHFTDTSKIASGTIINWNWNFDDGSFGNLHPSFNHYFNVVNDTFNVQLAVESDKGCKDTLVQKVNLLPIVKFNIDALNAEGCQPYNALFVDSSVVASPSTISNWKWGFGDGDFSYETNPAHMYLRDGVYYVNLEVTTSDNCKFTEVLQYPVIVHPHPVANFNNDYYETDVSNASMTFANSSANSNHYVWNFGDGTTSTEINPSHIFPDSGTYIVQLNVADNFGCMDSTVKVVRVNGIYSLYIPNSFTPNHDGINDIFKAYGYGVTNFKLEIFTRWGDKVFNSIKITDGWDGKNDNGVDAPVDSYVYRVSIERFDELKPKIYTGNVTLVR